jgi:hypothetical protein
VQPAEMSPARGVEAASFFVICLDLRFLLALRISHDIISSPINSSDRAWSQPSNFDALRACVATLYKFNLAIQFY